MDLPSVGLDHCSFEHENSPSLSVSNVVAPSFVKEQAHASPCISHIHFVIRLQARGSVTNYLYFFRVLRYARITFVSEIVMTTPRTLMSEIILRIA